MDPVKDLLPGIDEKLQERLDWLSETLNEAVIFGTWILKWDLDEAKGGYEQIPPILLFHDLLDTVLGIAAMIKQSSINSCKPLVRKLFELNFTLQYLLEKKDKTRGRCYLVWYYSERLKSFKKVDPTTPAGKELKQKLLKLDPTNPYHYPHVEGIGKRINNIIEILKYDEFKNEKIEYDEKKPRNWYSMYGGPKDLYYLSIHLKKLVYYEFFYRYLSGSVHGTDVLNQKMARGKSGSLAVYQLRHHINADEITHYTASLIIDSMRFYVQRRVKNKIKDFIDWRRDYVLNRYGKI